MRFCPRCRNWKPDALFAKGNPEQEHLGNVATGSPPGRFFRKCSQCRGKRPSSGVVPVPGPERIAPSLATVALILTARQERARFEERGAPRVKRVYTQRDKQMERRRRKLLASG